MFRPYSTADGHVPAWEYYMATGLTPKVGMALNLEGGVLVMASGAEKPQFICMRDEREQLGADAAPIPVIAVTDDIVFEATTAATFTVGDSCVITSDSLNVAAGDGSGIVVAAVDPGYVRVRFE